MALALLWLRIRGFIAFIPPFIWKWLAIGLAFFAVFSYGDLRGRRTEKAKWDAAVVVANTAAKDQDLQAEKDSHAQDLEVTNSLLQQKKVDDAAIEELRAQLATLPASQQCVYDNNNADPDERSAPKRVPNHVRRRPRASHAKPAGPTILPSALRGAKG